LTLVITRINNRTDIGGNSFNSEIIRGAYLVVAGGMIAYASAFYKRSRERFALLAPWPMSKPDEVKTSSVLQLLEHSAIVLEAPRIAAIWEELEEPYINLISWREGAFEELRRPAGTFGALVNPALSDATFLTADVGSEYVLLPKGPMRLSEPVIDPDLRVEFSICGVASAPFVGVNCAGRVFIFDRSDWSDDHLLLTEIIASRIGVELDRQVAQRRGEEAIALRERMRLTRDLHDGVLQSLTAAALQLNLADEALDQDRRCRLDVVKRLLANEQRRVREFVDEIFPKPYVERYTILGDLQRQLEETALHWDCKMSVSVAPSDAKVPAALASQLSLIVAEAVANAVRHGGASKVDVAIEKLEGSLAVNVRDDGRGFEGQPIGSSHQEHVMASSRAASVHERVRTLGGSLIVSSSPRGAKLAIQFPVS
jgi:signal transduction histidine kinase